MQQNHRAGGTEAWWIQGRACGPGSSVILLATAFAAVGLGCGPNSFPGREGFTSGETGVGTDTGTSDTGFEETETETETGEEECPELIAQGNVSVNSLEELELVAGVTAIEGDFEISGFFEDLGEEGLAGLSCLESVGGFAYIHDSDLVNFVGLERLREVGGYLYIGQNFALQDFQGLSALRSVGGFVNVTENPSLISTAGSDLLVEIGDFLFINQNPALQDLYGFSSIDGLDGQLRIEQNASLTSLDGLESIRGVGGDFGILANPSLFDTTALQNIERIGGNVLWQSNPEVFSLNLDSLLTIKGYMIVDNMPSLEDLDDLFGLQGINNSLYLWETGLTQIDGLADLEFLGGDVWIELNPNLEDVNGLSSLTTASGVVRIEQNAALVNAMGLSNLVEANAGLSLWGNPSLQFVNFTSLINADEFLRVGYSPIQTIVAPNLTVVGGDLLIFGLESDTGLVAELGHALERDGPRARDRRTEKVIGEANG